MDKNFDEWNTQKKRLDNQKGDYYFKPAEIWWCSVGVNVGSESCGKGTTFRRPVLILKKLSSTSCIAIPLTSKKKVGSWFAEVTIHTIKRWALLYQIRMMSSKRFQRRLATLDEAEFCKIKEKLEMLLELSSDHHSAKAEIGGLPQK
jgi:mRNA interferase MazF